MYFTSVCFATIEKLRVCYYFTFFLLLTRECEGEGRGSSASDEDQFYTTHWRGDLAALSPSRRRLLRYHHDKVITAC